MTAVYDSVQPPPRRLRAPRRKSHEWRYRFERACLLLTVFFSPMNFLRLDWVFFTLSDLLALLTLLIMLVNGRLPLRPMGPATFMWLGSVLLLTSGLMLSSIFNDGAVDGAIGVAQYGFALVLMPLIIFGRTPEELIVVAKTFVMSITFVMLHGAYYLHFSPDDIRFVSQNGRLLTLIERVNAAGTIGAITVCLVLWLVRIGALRRVTAVCAVIPIVYGILLTGSNSGFLLTIVGFLGFAFFSGSPGLLARHFGIGALFLAITLLWGEYFLPDVFFARVFDAVVNGDLAAAGSFSYRILLISEAVSIADGSGLIGLGMDQYRSASAHGFAVHNTYLLLLAEGGVLSLIGLAGLLCTIVLVGWQAMRSDAAYWSGALTLTVALIFACAMLGFTHVYARFWLVPVLIAMAPSLAALNPRRAHYD